jgi:hypothetical protein
MMLGDGGTALWGPLLESVNAIGGALFTVLGIVILRLLVRWRVLALALTFVCLSIVGTSDMAPGFPLSLVFALATGALLTLAAGRFGLLALTIAWFASGVLIAVPMTLNVSHWSAAGSNWTLAILAGLAGFGFYASRGAQPLFGTIFRD